MMMNDKGLLIVVSGPSGAGKGTVLHELIDNDPNIFYSISATTRAPREGEIHGENYFFVTKKEFENQIENELMLEYASYCGNYYGTPARAVDDMLSIGKDVVLEIEVQGAAQIKEKRPEAVLIFIIPPKFSEIENRLRGRNTESDDVIKDRLETAKREIDFAENYDYIVINDTVTNAESTINNIIKAEKAKLNYMKNYMKEVFF